MNYFLTKTYMMNVVFLILRFLLYERAIKVNVRSKTTKFFEFSWSNYLQEKVSLQLGYSVIINRGGGLVILGTDENSKK